jgi:hypothetical protein
MPQVVEGCDEPLQTDPNAKPLPLGQAPGGAGAGVAALAVRRGVSRRSIARREQSQA